MDIPTNKRLCKTCESIFTGPAPPPLCTGFNQKAPHHSNNWSLNPKPPHHPDMSSLTAAANIDCYICLRIWRRVRKESESFGELLDHLTPLEFSLSAGDETTFKLEISGFNHATALTFRHSFVGVELSRAASVDMQSLLAPSTRSQSSLQQARDWTFQCHNHHDHCARPNLDGELPTRLICVERDDTTSNISAYVCNSTSLPSDTPYLTLSHCWGNAKFLTLNKRNLDRFQESIPVALLSRVFQDALHVTLELGFQWIWIDSLCIIQDDTEDWVNESGRMGNVYKNATCNLSASSFKDGEGGFLPPSRHSNPVPPIVQLEWTSVPNVALRAHHGKLFTIHEDPPWFEIWGGHLFSRAWVLQEQILAPRALHFGTDQIFWECNGMLANEVWPLGWGRRTRKDHPFQEDFAISLESQPFWLFSLDKLDTFKPLLPHDIWRNIVKNYSSRKLTLSTDRLPALNGIASEFGKILKDDYMFGLWSKDLHIGLLWRQCRRIDDLSPKRPPDWSDMPSWSWASVGEPVSWRVPYPSSFKLHSGMTDRLSDILGCHVSSPDQNLAVRIRGHLMKFGSWNNPDILMAYYGGGWAYHTEFAGYTFALAYEDWLIQRIVGIEPRYHKFCGVGPPDTSDERQARIRSLFEQSYFMPMLYWSNDEDIGVIGILMLLSLEHGSGVYRRVGIANTWSGSKGSLRDFEADASGCQKNIRAEEYLEHGGNGRFVIELI